MVELMIMTYAGIVWLIFVKFKLVPLNTWTGLTAALGGIGMIGWVLLMMNMYQKSVQTPLRCHPL